MRTDTTRMETPAWPPRPARQTIDAADPGPVPGLGGGRRQRCSSSTSMLQENGALLADVVGDGSTSSSTTGATRSASPATDRARTCGSDLHARSSPAPSWPACACRPRARRSTSTSSSSRRSTTPSRSRSSRRGRRGGPAHAEGEEAAGHTHGEEEPLFTSGRAGRRRVCWRASSTPSSWSPSFGTVLRRRPPPPAGDGPDLVRTVWLAAVTFAAVVAGPGAQVPRQPARRRRPRHRRRADRPVPRRCGHLARARLSRLTRLSGVLRQPSRRRRPASRWWPLATVVAYGLLLALLPASPDEISPTCPPSSSGTSASGPWAAWPCYWAGLGLGLGWLLQRLEAGDPTPAPEPVAAAA